MEGTICQSDAQTNDCVRDINGVIGMEIYMNIVTIT